MKALTPQEAKNQVAKSKGYPDWETFENWIIDGSSFTADVAIQMVSAMEEAAEIFAQSKAAQAWEEGFVAGSICAGVSQNKLDQVKKKVSVNPYKQP